MPRPALPFDQAIADNICERIADGESLRAICTDEALPSRTTVFKWLATTTDFAHQYARAREAQADALADEILDIADDGRNDWMIRNGGGDDNPGWRENGEALNRSRLRVDARKWMAGKLQPKKYGEKLGLDHAASGDFAAFLANIAANGQRLLNTVSTGDE